MSLCETCVHAGVDCPIWSPGMETEKCVAYGAIKPDDEEIYEEIRIEDS